MVRSAWLLAGALTVVLLASPSQAQEIPCTGGQAVEPGGLSFPCSNVDLMARLPVFTFASPGSSPPNANNDIWGWTDPETGIEYALVATQNGVGFVDLSTPTQPRYLGKLPTRTVSSAWRDVKVYADHAFVVADGAGTHGVQVFDLTRLRSVTSPPQTFLADAYYDGIGSAHNIVINEATGYAYIVGALRLDASLPAECDSRGFHVIDVRDPLHPTFVTCFSDASMDTTPRITPGYTHDAQCVVYHGPDTDHVGDEICFGANEDVLTLFDVTDKENVTILSQAQYPSDAYTHQGWLTADQRYVLLDDELDERNGLVATQRTMVMDVQDLDNPGLAFIYNSALTTIDHNLYVRGRYAFESNYEAGLRILNLDEIESGTLTEVAYFDTFPQGDGVSFRGQWSNYPFFESGLIVANDINNGLFVLRPAASLAVGAEDAPERPAAYTLTRPSPNPARNVTHLTLRVERTQSVRADLYDVAGRHVASLYEGTVSRDAPRDMVVAGDGLPAGVYLVRVVGERFATSQRVVLTR